MDTMGCGCIMLPLHHILLRASLASGGHFQGGQFLGVLELPAIEGLLAGRDDVGLGHGQVHRVHLYVLGVQRCADRVAEYQHVLHTIASVKLDTYTAHNSKYSAKYIYCTH